MDTRFSNQVMALIARIERLSGLGLSRSLQPYGLTYAEFRLVGLLWGEKYALSQKELSERMGLDPSGVSLSLKRLERKGVVTLIRDARDQRVTRVRLAENIPSLADILNCIADHEKNALAGLGTSQKAELVALLGRVADNLERTQKQHDQIERPGSAGGFGVEKRRS